MNNEYSADPIEQLRAWLDTDGRRPGHGDFDGRPVGPHGAPERRRRARAPLLHELRGTQGTRARREPAAQRCSSTWTGARSGSKAASRRSIPPNRTSTGRRGRARARSQHGCRRQSEPIESREELDRRFAEFDAAHPEELARPPHWGGFRLFPESYEFWEHRDNRLHDRVPLPPRRQRVGRRAPLSLASAAADDQPHANWIPSSGTAPRSLREDGSVPAAGLLPPNLADPAPRPPDQHACSRQPLTDNSRDDARRGRLRVERRERHGVADPGSRGVRRHYPEVVRRERLEVENLRRDQCRVAWQNDVDRRRRSECGCGPPLEPRLRLVAAWIDGPVEERKPVAGLRNACDGDWCGRRSLAPAGFCDCRSREKQHTDRRNGLHTRPFPWPTAMIVLERK